MRHTHDDRFADHSTVDTYDILSEDAAAGVDKDNVRFTCNNGGMGTRMRRNETVDHRRLCHHQHQRQHATLQHRSECRMNRMTVSPSSAGK